MLDHYGAVLHRVPLDFGFGCPNRDADGSGGCTFCAADGGRARQALSAETDEEQVASGIRFARRRYGATAFMAYVQAFTGTFAPESEQRKRIGRVLGRFPFHALSVGTRPDCLPDSSLEALCELRNSLDVWVELGVQTAHDRTLARIRRGHTWEQSKQAIQRLHGAGLRVAAHIITGLPGETPDEVRGTAEALARLPIDGIKIHNLHVVRGTELAQEYAQRAFPLPDEYEHAEMVVDILTRLPPTVAVMRLQTDTEADCLVAPHWAMSKNRFLAFVDEQMRLRERRQGDLFASASVADPARPFRSVSTDDGSVTLWNPDFHEHYHAPPGAASEACAKYVLPARLPERLSTADASVLDIGFGLGYNTLSACEAAADCPHSLIVTALEADRRAVRAAAQFVTPPPTARLPWRRLLRDLWRDGAAVVANSALRVLWGDARHTLRRAAERGPFDVVFLDPFSTQRNSELWTLDFFRRIRHVLAADGVLLTYSTAKPVIAGLLEAGFEVGQAECHSPHRASTVAALDRAQVTSPLSQEVIGGLRNTTGGIPYRDPTQTATNKEILRSRQLRVESAKSASSVP